MYTVKEYEFKIGMNTYKADFVPEVIIDCPHAFEPENFYEENMEIESVSDVYKYMPTFDGWQRTHFDDREVKNAILEKLYMDQYGESWNEIVEEFKNYKEEEV